MQQPEPSTGAAREGGIAALIVTLRMDDESAAHFTALRKKHFPAHRNWLDAHITLFHALPGVEIDRVVSDIGSVAARTSTFIERTDNVLFLGAGVAYALSSDKAAGLRSALASGWGDLLGRQDRMWRGPLHITVQNKVDPTTARDLYNQLAKEFTPREILATGVDVWHYEGGPWRHAAAFDFS